MPLVKACQRWPRHDLFITSSQWTAPGKEETRKTITRNQEQLMLMNEDTSIGSSHRRSLQFGVSHRAAKVGQRLELDVGEWGAEKGREPAWLVVSLVYLRFARRTKVRGANEEGEESDTWLESYVIFCYTFIHQNVQNEGVT